MDREKRLRQMKQMLANHRSDLNLLNPDVRHVYVHLVKQGGEREDGESPATLTWRISTDKGRDSTRLICKVTKSKDTASH